MSNFKLFTTTVSVEAVLLTCKSMIPVIHVDDGVVDYGIRNTGKSVCVRTSDGGYCANRFTLTVVWVYGSGRNRRAAQAKPP